MPFGYFFCPVGYGFGLNFLPSHLWLGIWAKKVIKVQHLTFAKKIAVEILINGLAELDAQMPVLAETLNGRRKIALYGNLGAGKTTLVQAFCRWLGVEDSPTSPTFSLINEYGYRDSDDQPALVHHIDLYRLNSAQEAFDIGIEEILYDPWYCFIEWPQIIEPLLPEETVKIQLDILSETARRLLIL